ncbi:ribonuclease H2, subunit B [Boeremia exigua]|uniref:ribonuclease H2, subunit B n=1 Tax=Boeremia exigua TaxID=749465 RepID=UPI001E8DCB51|nr:ribonuclease H2, subunit B [Boeremia exigua]KAH6616492.1 ribonuclease H2, subunit B [Boeremia exigua]
MARATRAKPAPKEATPEPTPSTTKPLPAATSNPPKLFILPKDTSSDARIVTLDDPATSTPSRYYFCPSKGFYEFTRIAAPKKACRSWLITSEDDKALGNEKIDDEEAAEKKEDTETGLGSGFVTKNADLFLATPIDLLFLILPALAPKSAKEAKQHFRELDDYTDMLSASSRHWRTLLAQYPTLKGMLEKKMRALCDTVDAGDETMYRISPTKLHALLVAKAERMVQHGLPPSMEDKFVKSVLDIPVMSIRRDDSSLSAVPADPEFQPTEPTEPTVADADADADADAPAPPSLTTPPEVPHLLRLKTALTYLTTAYLPPLLRPAILTAPTPDFTPLTTHLAALAKLKAEAAALRSISDNISRKRGIEMDEERLAEREEKKRKKEDEEKRKKSESLAVKKLRSVDTRGMRKMSAFFSAVPKK